MVATSDAKPGKYVFIVAISYTQFSKSSSLYWNSCTFYWHDIYCCRKRSASFIICAGFLSSFFTILFNYWILKNFRVSCVKIVHSNNKRLFRVKEHRTIEILLRWSYLQIRKNFSCGLDSHVLDHIFFLWYFFPMAVHNQRYSRWVYINEEFLIKVHIKIIICLSLRGFYFIT